MRHLLIAALLAFGGSAHAAGLGCQNTTGGLVLEKIRADAVGTQPFGCINRSIDILSAVAVDTNTFAALSKSTAALSVSTESLRVSVNLKANLAGATFTGASGITNQAFTATGPNGFIISGSSVNASAFFGNGAGLTNIPNTSPCAVGAGANSLLCQGVTNSATGIQATVSGGASNAGGGGSSVVAGGTSNSAGASYGVVSGGFNNVANGVYANITGGGDNTVAGDYSAAVGGTFNNASSSYSFVAGRRAKAGHMGAFVWADSTNADYSSTLANSFNVRAGGGAFFSAHVSAVNSSVTASGFFGNGSALTGVSDTTKVAKTGDTMTGTLNMTNVGVTLTGASGNVTSASSVTASGFFGNGAGLTGVTGTDSSKVLKAGDTMTGALNMTNVAVNLTGASGNLVSGASVTASGIFGNGGGITNLSGAALQANSVTNAKTVGTTATCLANEYLSEATWTNGLPSGGVCKVGGTGSGDAVLAATQTFSGANTFTSSVTFRGPVLGAWVEVASATISAIDNYTFSDGAVVISSAAYRLEYSIFQNTTAGIPLITVNGATTDYRYSAKNLCDNSDETSIFSTSDAHIRLSRNALTASQYFSGAATITQGGYPTGRVFVRFVTSGMGDAVIGCTITGGGTLATTAGLNAIAIKTSAGTMTGTLKLYRRWDK